MERGKKYDTVYNATLPMLGDVTAFLTLGIELYKGDQYINIDTIIVQLNRFKECGATHVEVDKDIEGYVLDYFRLMPIKERDETDEELQTRIDYEERKKNAKQLEAENTRIKELKQLRFLKAKYPEEK